MTTTEIQHIYWFAPYNLTCPSTRYRGRIPLDALHQQWGITYDFFFPQRNLAAYLRFAFLWLKLFFFRKKNSLIVIQKICSNRWYAKALKFLVAWHPKDTVYDLDDAEYYRQPTDTLHYFLGRCERIQVGSETLAEYCSGFNEKVHIATSPVYQHCYQKKQKNSLFTIGWVGDFGNGAAISKDFSHKRSMFECLFPALQKIEQPFRLIIVGVKNPQDIPLIKEYFAPFSHIQLEVPVNLNWVEDAWIYELISTFDIGVSPLVGHPFNQAKSAFKAKQYLSCGVPVVASDVGENGTFVNAKNGRLCQNVADFENAIHFFMGLSEEHYRRYCQKALEGARAFSMEVYCKHLLS